jgi:hypothetical protein
MPDPLDQAALLCDPFYVTQAPLGRSRKGHPIVKPGQLVWAHQVYPTRQPYIVDCTGYDPRDSTNNTYAIRRLTDDNSGTHFPIKELDLRADENLYIMYGKKRPAIVLQTIETTFYNQSNPEPYVLVAPCFTFKDKHAPEFRARVAAFQYPHLFFLPGHPINGSNQGVVRFEHIQPVAAVGVEPRIYPGPKQCFVSDDAWAVLQHRLSLFLNGKGLDSELEDDIRAYSECVMEAYAQGSGS